MNFIPGFIRLSYRLHSLTLLRVAPFKSVKHRIKTGLRNRRTFFFTANQSLTIHSFSSLQTRSHLTRLHKVATWWIFHAINRTLLQNNRSFGMGMTTMGVKLDDATRERIKTAATRSDRTPHWLIKQAIFNYLERLESEEGLPELPALLAGAANESEEAATAVEENHQPFLEFAEQILPQSVSRAAITGAYRRAETDAVPMLLEQARLPEAVAAQAHSLAYQLADKLRNQKTASGRAGMVQGLLQEFSLSSQEGVALMCLAEALLRIPDKATRDALIRDKISNGN